MTAEVAAHWRDLDKELLVSAGMGVPRGSLLDGAQSCCPGEEEVLNLLVPVAH